MQKKVISEVNYYVARTIPRELIVKAVPQVLEHEDIFFTKNTRGKNELVFSKNLYKLAAGGLARYITDPEQRKTLMSVVDLLKIHGDVRGGKYEKGFTESLDELVKQNESPVIELFPLSIASPTVQFDQNELDGLQILSKEVIYDSVKTSFLKALREKAVDSIDIPDLLLLWKMLPVHYSGALSDDISWCTKPVINKLEALLYGRAVQSSVLFPKYDAYRPYIEGLFRDRADPGATYLEFLSEVSVEDIDRALPVNAPSELLDILTKACDQYEMHFLKYDRNLQEKLDSLLTYHINSKLSEMISALMDTILMVDTDKLLDQRFMKRKHEYNRFILGIVKNLNKAALHLPDKMSWSLYHAIADYIGNYLFAGAQFNEERFDMLKKFKINGVLLGKFYSILNAIIHSQMEDHIEVPFGFEKVGS